MKFDFKEWRLEMGYTQKLAGKKLNRSESSIQAYEQGIRNADQLVIDKAKELLNQKRGSNGKKQSNRN